MAFKLSGSEKKGGEREREKEREKERESNEEDLQ